MKKKIKDIMKYIRNKGGVYKIFDTHNGASNHWGYKENEHLTILLDEEDIKNSKTADTIEELCDEFVIKVNIHNIVVHDFRSALNITKNYKNHELTKDYKIYGAIWTDKGLIYVAELNEKGEFELL